jgi:hypothetical protein
MENEREYKTLALAARAFVMANYQWEDQVDKLESFISAKNVYAET